MKDILIKAFGGLSMQYYLRQLIFGCLFALFVLFISAHGDQSLPINLIVMLLLNTLLYPYARFVYESIVEFVMGRNVFWVNALLLLLVKFITMLLCWSFAVFIAPIGLIWLFVRGKAA